MRRGIAGAIALVAWAVAGPARAEIDVVPHLEAGAGQTGESLSVPVGDGQRVSATRDLYALRWALGAEYGPFGGLAFAGGAVHLRSAVAADVLLGPGRWALTAEQDLRWRRPVGPLALAAGPGVAARLDLERPGFGTLEIGLPIGLRWGLVELDWRPAWRVPLGEQTVAMLGGERRHGASAGINWLALSLRVHLAGLAW